MPLPRVIPALLASLLFLSACAASGPAYSPAAKRELGLLKGRSVRLMEKAEQPYEEHTKAANTLMQQLAAAREAAQGRVGNGTAVAQWNLMLDAEGHLVGGFLSRWQADTTLRPAFIAQAIDLVEASFAAMEAFELAKIGAPK